MRCGPPIVDDLYTRQLERGAVVRASVEHATVVAATPAGVELATTATARRRIGPSAAGFPLADGTSLTGRLRIDAPRRVPSRTIRMSPLALESAHRRYGASSIMPPKNPRMPSATPPGVKSCRQASHSPDSDKNPMKSQLNCPCHVMAPMSAKNTGSRFQP